MALIGFRKKRLIVESMLPLSFAKLTRFVEISALKRNYDKFHPTNDAVCLYLQNEDQQLKRSRRKRKRKLP